MYKNLNDVHVGCGYSIKLQHLEQCMIWIYIYTLLHELACNNRDMHANECNKNVYYSYQSSVLSLPTQSTK